jgi:RimJ/RimL family protein N-acetyltransferase
MDDQLRLRAVGEDDLPLLYRLTSDPSATGEYGWFGWRDPGEYRRPWEENGLLSDDDGVLVVAKAAESLGFMNWSKHQTTGVSYCWEFGMALAPEARGRGYGAQAMRLLVAYLFSHTLVNRIEAVTETGNIAAQRALEKAGFTREGVLREIGFRGGRWVDGMLYSILRAEVDLPGTETGGPA